MDRSDYGILISGGDKVADYPNIDFESGPRMYDSEPRPVRLRVTTFAGIAPGASHWYASIQEEDNLVAFDADRVWLSPSDDATGKGRRLTFLHRSYERVIKWMARKLEEEFDLGGKHRVAPCAYVDGCLPEDFCATCDVLRFMA